VRVRSGELLVTDGPFAETREQIWWLHSDRRQPYKRSGSTRLQDSEYTFGRSRGAARQGADEISAKRSKRVSGP
jgi:hypothetical protein